MKLPEEQPEKKLSKKELALQRALELEEADSARAAAAATTRRNPATVQKGTESLEKEGRKDGSQTGQEEQAKKEGNNDDENA